MNFQKQKDTVNDEFLLTWEDFVIQSCIVHYTQPVLHPTFYFTVNKWWRDFVQKKKTNDEEIGLSLRDNQIGPTFSFLTNWSNLLLPRIDDERVNEGKGKKRRDFFLKSTIFYFCFSPYKKENTIWKSKE